MQCKKIFAHVAFALSAVLISGCGDGLPNRTPVEGTVVYEDGSPVANAAVMFHPQGDLESKNAMGTTDDEGKFIMFTYRDARDPDGAPIGSHKVTVSGVNEAAVQPNQEGEIDDSVSGELSWFVDSKFALVETTPLTVDVTKGMEPITFQVTR